MAKDDIRPVRYKKGHGWYQCKPYEAHKWEVRCRGKLIGRYADHKTAMHTLEMHRKQMMRPKRSYRLGSRMVRQ